MSKKQLESPRQKDVFLEVEGDQWFVRNQRALQDADPRCDPVLTAAAGLPRPRRVLEIGCASGWRLDHMARAWGAECFGVDPSAAAIAEGKARCPALTLVHGTAGRLPFADRQFDLLVFGFCLYLCDPDDHFRIAAEADRVVKEGGWLIVYDFLPPRPYRNTYKHRAGLHAYKMDYARMFTWHPAYHVHVVSRAEPGDSPAAPDDRIAVTVLRRSMSEAFPDNRYRAP